MSKKKRKSTSQGNRQQTCGIVRIFNKINLALPENCRLPRMSNVRTLKIAKTKFNDLDAKLTKLKGVVRISQDRETTFVRDERALASIATNAWRAKIKMVDSNTGESKEGMKRVYRHIEAISDALNQIGVEVIDLTGDDYDSGMALKVVTFEQTPGLIKEEIKETIKPSIAWKGQLIQMGEVIVGTP